MKVPLGVRDFFERAELVYGDRVGVVDEPDAPGGGLGSLTWARYAELARAQAARLDQLGVGVGERVAVLSQNSARLMVAFYGVSGFGRVCVPINYRLNAEEIRFILEHSGARVLMVDPSLKDRAADLGVEHVIVLGTETDERLYALGSEPEPWAADEDATAVINYTSGTTARPKGVEQTHRSLWINAVTFGLHTTVSDRDVYLHTLPMFHCNGWGMPYALAGVGAQHIVLRNIDGAEILRRVEKHGVTMMCGAPTVLSRILDAAEAFGPEVPGRGRVRVVVAGAPPPTQIIERVESELGWELIQIYGLTETAPLLTINRRRAEDDAVDARERAKRLSRAGAPALGVKLRVDGQGEVLARSNVVLKGYWEQPDATAEAIVDGWFHTGDGGTLDGEHYLTITDRKKDVIITGGENVSSIEVEDCLFSHPEVAECAVIGVPDDAWGESVMGLVVLTDGSATTEAELIAYCRDQLAHFKCPKRVEVRTSLPRTATGKLQKFKLRAPYWEGRERQIN